MTADERAPLDVEALRAGVLGTSTFFTRVDVVDETGSTNADLIASAAGGADIDGAVLIAEHQTAGRGRQGRSWLGAPGAQIIVSVGVDAGGVPVDGWGWLPLVAGVAIVDAVGTPNGVEVGLKWPNDVLSGGRKLAGVLSEVAAPQRTIVVGIGLNVTLRGDEVAPAPDATSLAELGVENLDRNRIVIDLLRHLGERISMWRSDGGAGAGLADDYRARCLTLGTRVRAILPDSSEIVGVALDVDNRGRLCIDRDGQTLVVSAGDVKHLRPAL
jgi:BirA family transcriptional regulator, biotin operon repressor / biotin---[acetyl-CoA-carboxylase] ligase